MQKLTLATKREFARGAADKEHISHRRIAVLCAEQRVKDATILGKYAEDNFFKTYTLLIKSKELKQHI